MEEKVEEKNPKKMKVDRVIILLCTLLITLFFTYLKIEDAKRILSLEEEITITNETSNNLKSELERTKKLLAELQGTPYPEAFNRVVKKLQPRIDPSIVDIISSSILKECKNKNLDPELILAVSFVESGMNPMAESEAGAVGIMQVRYKTWKEEPELKDNGVKAKYQLFWIPQNIQCGTTIFRKYYDQEKGDLAKTLRRYNSGKEMTEPVFKYEYISKVTYTLMLIREFMMNNDQLDTEVLMEPVTKKGEVKILEKKDPKTPEKKDIKPVIQEQK